MNGGPARPGGEEEEELVGSLPREPKHTHLFQQETFPGEVLSEVLTVNSSSFGLNTTKNILKHISREIYIIV